MVWILFLSLLRKGLVMCGGVWFGKVWQGMVGLGKVRYGFFIFKLIKDRSMVGYGLVRLGTVR